MRVFRIFLFLLVSNMAWSNSLLDETNKALNQIHQIEIKTSGEAPTCDQCFTPTSNLCVKFNHFKNRGVPVKALKQALYFFKHNQNQIENSRYISIADYTQHSSKKRFYILDMETGTMRQEKVSHGSGNRKRVKYGDPEHDGMINRCHHKNNIKDRTNMTRAGFFRTANLYYSAKHDRKRGGAQEWPYLNDNKANGMRMHGLSSGVNDEAMSSGVVMHGAWYNDITDTMGRSYGCPAFESKAASEVINTIKNGTLYYAYTPICNELHHKVLNQISGWESFCGE